MTPREGERSRGGHHQRGVRRSSCTASGGDKPARPARALPAKLASRERRGLAGALRAPRGGGDAYLFPKKKKERKIGEGVQRTGAREATKGGGPRRKGDGRGRSSSRNRGSRWNIMSWEG